MAEKHYTQYYVAFLDILGFKDLVSNPETTCQDILKIYEVIEILHKRFSEITEYMKADIKMKIMSDSICAYVETDTPDALFALIVHCALYQFGLSCMYPNNLVRGGITVGDMYAKGDIIFGQALTEAYLLEEKNAKVPRVILRKKTLEHALGKHIESAQMVLQNWVVRDDDAFYTVNYFKLFSLFGFQDKIITMALTLIKSTVSNWLDTTIDESIRQKYLYVEKQMNKYIKEHPDA